MPVLKNAINLQDPTGDASGSRDVVGNTTYPAAFIYNDGSYIYFRLRLNSSPEGRGGQGFLQPFGWGLLLDTNLNNANYEWMIMVDGISQTEVINLWQNTVQGNVGSPSDAPEILAYSISLNGNYQISLADSSFSGNPDYFLDWRFPYNIFKQYTGLTDYSPLRLFFGSSSSTNTLTADLVGASDLYAGFTDYITPFGTKPTTGTVRFVADLTGNGDITQQCVVNTIYIRVDDADQNKNPVAIDTVQITLSVPGGDSENLVLLETGNNTGIFTGSIFLTYDNIVSGDQILQVQIGSTITATYIDNIDANLQLNQVRTDTFVVCGPILQVTKTVAPSNVTAGETVVYTITIQNTGTGAAFINQIQDVLPSGFSFVNGTTTGITSNNPSINGQILTWNGSWSIPAGSSNSLIFSAHAASVPGTYFNNVSVSGTNFPAFHTGDTAPVSIGAPVMTLTKTADKTSAAPGEEITYTIYYKNTGYGQASFVIITDTIPPNTNYVGGSLRKGNASSTYGSASPLTDAADSDEGYISGNMVIFNIGNVGPNDGVPDTGNDEGKVYFKVKID